jgi:agmatinase
MADPANFLGLPAGQADPRTARYVVLPVPYEGTVSYEAGTAAGPAAILAASTQVELFDEETLREYHLAGVATAEPVPSAADPAGQMARVRAAAGPHLDAGRFLLTLGGEHSITAPVVAAAAERFEGLCVLQIDAHADLRSEYEGTPHSHAAVMRRVMELTGPDRIVQVGVRSLSAEEAAECPEQVARLITPHIVRARPDWIDLVLARLTGPVYVTIDIDGFDPAEAPGTGTPEPGGLRWHEVTGLLRRVCAERRVVAGDVVEVRPLPASVQTEFLAARLTAKIVAYTQTQE